MLRSLIRKLPCNRSTYGLFVPSVTGRQVTIGFPLANRYISTSENVQNSDNIRTKSGDAAERVGGLPMDLINKRKLEKSSR